MQTELRVSDIPTADRTTALSLLSTCAGHSEEFGGARNHRGYLKDLPGAQAARTASSRCASHQRNSAVSIQECIYIRLSIIWDHDSVASVVTTSFTELIICARDLY